jgi:hypothetical protein
MNELSLASLARFILMCGKTPNIQVSQILLLEIIAWPETGEYCHRTDFGEPNGAIRGPEAEIRGLRRMAE